MAENQGSEPSSYRILVADDEELMRSLIVTVLSNVGHVCITATDGIDALDKMKVNKIDAVITDVKMPKMDGIMLTREVSSQYPEVPIMVMTGYDEEYSAGTAIALGAREFIKKPFSLDEFTLRLHKMINDAELMRKLKSEKKGDEDLDQLMIELEATLKEH